jgi:2'-5' RNA ligase
MGLKKYFLAIVIPEPILAQIEDIKLGLQKEYGITSGLRSPAHITLHRPFVWKEEKETELIKKLGKFNFTNSFKLQLTNYNWFEPRVIYIDVMSNPTLNELHQGLKKYAKQELNLFNEVDDKRGFHPHITIAFRDLKKPLFYELQGKFKNETFANSFDYKGFSLLKFEKRWEIIEMFEVSE